MRSLRARTGRIAAFWFRRYLAMIDPKLLRTQTDTIAAQLARRGFTLDVAAFRELEERRKALQIESEQLQSDCFRLIRRLLSQRPRLSVTVSTIPY